MNRVDKHELPKRRIASRLRKMGLKVQTVPTVNGHDLLINDQHRVALRVAFPSLRQHSVTIGDKVYRYRYRTWHFNFHHHGKLGKRYTDYFLCLPLSNHPVPGNDVFVIPWKDVSGKTFSLHDGKREYAGHYAKFRNAWNLLPGNTAPSSGLRFVA